MSAIGNQVAQQHKGSVVELVTLDDFVERAARGDRRAATTEPFKQRYLQRRTCC